MVNDTNVQDTLNKSDENNEKTKYKRNAGYRKDAKSHRNIDGEANGEEKKNPWKDILDLVVYCAVILLITFLIVHFVGQRTEVIGNSMVPTLADGDNLIVDKISYRFRDPERFDIIVFPSPDEPGKNYIKRIIGLPGETVQIDGDVIYINGQLLEENYGAEPMQYSGTAQEGVILGEDEYFVLGDNRNVSKDSRYDIVGNISRDDIIGRAWLRIWPLRQFGFLKHQ
ncbi:MAG: signal peptidase I [Lachnospiraceae bacterium]|nr:signal peptidase I [Lachnospiraceae bacterium]